MRTVAAGRGGDEQLSLTAERARLAREQADQDQDALKNAALRQELVDVKKAERAWSDPLRAIRSCLLSVPSRCRTRLGHLPVADTEVIDDEVRDVLTEEAGG
jgi:phage terminase Nu1 subunit (DNA packaging protein)